MQLRSRAALIGAIGDRQHDPLARAIDVSTRQGLVVNLVECCLDLRAHADRHQRRVDLPVAELERHHAFQVHFGSAIRDLLVGPHGHGESGGRKHRDADDRWAQRNAHHRALRGLTTHTPSNASSATRTISPTTKSRIPAMPWMNPWPAASPR